MIARPQENTRCLEPCNVGRRSGVVEGFLAVIIFTTRAMKDCSWKAAQPAVVLLLVAGCTTVGQVTTLSDQNCRHTFVDQMSSILVEQGEKQDVADKLAESTVTVLSSGSLGPRPFGVASPSGADYGFFVEQKSLDCLLRLFSRQKGLMRYRNNFTYIATRSLTGCMCME